ncbi:MAG: glycerophosphodiester phosphodiesterase [Verrucomicrobiales bacterium]|nr:glycerophosphodiester phosphodiesterase [Verrucomicrobiales bacterium]
MNTLSMILWMAAFSILACGVVATGRAEAPVPTALELLRSKRPLVIGHRGYPAVAPENSLPSFRRALAAGADLIELDYHHSKDGIPVVVHDGTLDRTTDAVQRWGGSHHKPGDYTVGQLKELQTGLWFKPPYPDAPFPTLREAMEVIQKGSVTLIERKGGDAATCVKLLREQGLINRVVVQAFDWRYLRDFRALDQAQVLAALGPPYSRDGKRLADSEKALNASWLDEIKSMGAQVAAWNSQVDKTAVRAAHRRGLKVWVYTINDEATAHRLLDAGVDGIITDNPALLWKCLAMRR